MKLQPWVGAALALVGGLAALPAVAQTPAFQSRAEAIAYLSQSLPKVTAENPKYVSKADGTVSRWLTDRANFVVDPRRGVCLSARERYWQGKEGAMTPGSHQASYALADVAISELVDPEQVTPDGAASRGVLFSCKTPGCVAAVWNGKAARSDKTDVSIQDDAARAKILAAFHYLQSGAK